MFCRKCGRELPDDSVFCPKCGTRTKDIPSDDEKNQAQKKLLKSPENDKADSSSTRASVATPHIIRYVGVGVAAIICIIIIFALVNRARTCSSSGCDHVRIDGSRYCQNHTCSYSGCANYKSKGDKYCISHEVELLCAVEGCEGKKADGSEYCRNHKCSTNGCSRQKYNDTDYCELHQVNMRKRLGYSPDVSFSINSAGGIVFSFKAENKTQKEIKYVRFPVKLYNAVGDAIEDEIKGTTSVEVEIIGPFAPGETVSLSKKIIGYAEDCRKISIGTVTIIYSDGSSETGEFN